MIVNVDNGPGILLGIWYYVGLADLPNKYYHLIIHKNKLCYVYLKIIEKTYFDSVYQVCNEEHSVIHIDLNNSDEFRKVWPK